MHQDAGISFATECVTKTIVAFLESLKALALKRLSQARHVSPPRSHIWHSWSDPHGFHEPARPGISQEKVADRRRHQQLVEAAARSGIETLTFPSMPGQQC